MSDHSGLDPHGIAIALTTMPPLSATEVAATWALSGDPRRRLAVVSALAWPFRMVGDDIIIDHLSRDEDPTIRTAAAIAAWVRRDGGCDDGLLHRLAHDQDAGVRCIARLANGDDSLTSSPGTRSDS